MLAASALAGAGCADVRKSVVADIALDTELKAHFQDDAGVLRIPGGVLWLSVKRRSAEVEKVMPGNDRVLAVRIAKFARAHYTDTAGLRFITVVFKTKGDGEPVNGHRTYAGDTWLIATLDSLPDPKPADGTMSETREQGIPTARHGGRSRLSRGGSCGLRAFSPCSHRPRHR
jgi:hypothetical protein